MTKPQRLDLCNEIIKIIASHGRRFFSMNADSPAPGENPRISYLELDARGRIWFIDKYTQKKIYVAYEGRWRGFSEGGTLQSLVKALRNYIRDERLTIPFGHFGPWLDHLCGGDPWGYGKEEMAEVRRKVVGLFN